MAQRRDRVSLGQKALDLRRPHFVLHSLAFLYNAEPFLTATKPVKPSAFLAFCTATVQPWILLYAFLPAALAFLLTSLPLLLLTMSDFFSPPLVFSLPPRNTLALARLPLAILLTVFFMAFMAFIAFMAFVAFIAFMAFIAFIAFIADAMFHKHSKTLNERAPM